MKILITLSIIIFTVLGCSRKKNQNIIRGHDNYSLNIKDDKKTIKDIDRNVENLSYVVKDGIIIDTIFQDTLVEKVKILNSKIIDGKTYLICSKYLVEEPLQYDLSFYYDGHYIYSTDLKNPNFANDVLIEIDKLFISDVEIRIGSSCSYDDIIDFERLNVFPDSDSTIYIYTSLPLCSDYYNHVIYKNEQHVFVRLIELESSDKSLFFRNINDSLIVCNLTELSENKFEKYLFEYNYLEKTQKLTTVESIKDYYEMIKNIESREIDNIVKE